jgi:menaquinone-dependent protoporphyrinogen IX oxidase
MKRIACVKTHTVGIELASFAQRHMTSLHDMAFAAFLVRVNGVRTVEHLQVVHGHFCHCDVVRVVR